MLSIDNQTNLHVDIENLQYIYNELSKRDLELIFMDDEAIKEVNFAHRGKNKATDVLSFPLEDFPHAPLGTIIISLDTAKKASLEFNHSLEDEVSLLFIHGFLHVIGYDHETDSGQMREEEKRLIEKFKLPKSLIIRTTE